MKKYQFVKSSNRCHVKPAARQSVVTLLTLVTLVTLCRAQIVPSTLSVMVNTNQALVQPTNFFAANSNLLNAAVAGGGAINYVTNAIAPAQIFVGSANSNAVAKTLTGDAGINTNGAVFLANTSQARTDLGLGTAATENSGTFAQTANNGSDFASLAGTAKNIGIYGLAGDPSNTVGGVTGSYPQQIGIDSAFDLYFHGSGTNWDGVPTFVAGVNQLGSAFDMNASFTGFTKLYAAGSPSLQTAATLSSDFGYVVEGMNPYSRQVLGLDLVSTNVNGAAISTNSSGVKVYRQWDEAFEMAVENFQGRSNNVIGYGLLVSPNPIGQLFGVTGAPGGMTIPGNYGHWAFEASNNVVAGVPLWVNGVNNPGDSRFKWAFDVSPVTGHAFALGPIYSGTLSNQLTQANGYLDYTGAFDPNETGAVNFQNVTVTATNYLSGVTGTTTLAYGMGGGGGNGLAKETQAHGITGDLFVVSGSRVITANPPASHGDGGWISTGNVSVGDDTSLASSDTTGTATFAVFGSQAHTISGHNASYTLADTDYTVVLNASSLTATLPSAASHAKGREYIIKNIFSGSATVATTSSQTIDGSTTYSLAAQYKYVHVQSDGTNWVIIGNN